MRRLVREAPQVRNPQSSRFRTIARDIAAAPLLAGIIAAIGCSEVNSPNECRTYNETTVTLNRKTDGQSIDLRRLENIQFGSILTGYPIDFINEAHAIASEGLPSETKATQSPSYCLMSGPNGGQKSAYAQQSDADGAQRGLYVPDNQSLSPITLINLVNHEIGHLQPGNPENGSEIMSQINEYEQKLAGFTLLMRQGADSGQLVRWSYHESRSGLYHKLSRTLESGRGQTGNEPLDAYDLANMFIFMRLGVTGGNIPAIRAEFRERVANGTLEMELEAASESFLGEYSTENLPDLFIGTRMRLINATQRQYGAAGSYFQAHSQLLDSGLVFGLDGMNCALAAPPAEDVFTPCGDSACIDAGADSSRQISVSLCCVAADVRADAIGFSKWSVQASGTEYQKEGGKVSAMDFGWDSVTHLSPTKTAIGMDEPCI